MLTGSGIDPKKPGLRAVHLPGQSYLSLGLPDASLRGSRHRIIRIELNIDRDQVPLSVRVALLRIYRMNDILFVRIGRVCHEYQGVAIVMMVGSWNTQRVNRMMSLCGLISTAG